MKKLLTLGFLSCLTFSSLSFAKDEFIIDEIDALEKSTIVSEDNNLNESQTLSKDMQQSTKDILENSSDTYLHSRKIPISVSLYVDIPLYIDTASSTDYKGDRVLTGFDAFSDIYFLLKDDSLFATTTFGVGLKSKTGDTFLAFGAGFGGFLKETNLYKYAMSARFDLGPVFAEKVGFHTTLFLRNELTFPISNFVGFHLNLDTGYEYNHSINSMFIRVGFGTKFS